MKAFTIGMLLLLVAGTATGAGLAPSGSTSRGKYFQLCINEAGSGTCTNPAGEDAYAQSASYVQFTFTFSETGGAGASCDIYYGTQELINALPTSLVAADGVKVITLSATVNGFSTEAPFTMLFADCTAGTGTHSVFVEAAR